MSGNSAKSNIERGFHRKWSVIIIPLLTDTTETNCLGTSRCQRLLKCYKVLLNPLNTILVINDHE